MKERNESFCDTFLIKLSNLSIKVTPMYCIYWTMRHLENCLISLMGIKMFHVITDRDELTMTKPWFKSAIIYLSFIRSPMYDVINFQEKGFGVSGGKNISSSGLFWIINGQVGVNCLYTPARQYMVAPTARPVVKWPRSPWLSRREKRAHARVHASRQCRLTICHAKSSSNHQTPPYKFPTKLVNGTWGIQPRKRGLMRMLATLEKELREEEVEKESRMKK